MSLWSRFKAWMRGEGAEPARPGMRANGRRVPKNLRKALRASREMGIRPGERYYRKGRHGASPHPVRMIARSKAEAERDLRMLRRYGGQGKLVAAGRGIYRIVGSCPEERVGDLELALEGNAPRHPRRRQRANGRGKARKGGRAGNPFGAFGLLIPKGANPRSVYEMVRSYGGKIGGGIDQGARGYLADIEGVSPKTMRQIRDHLDGGNFGRRPHERRDSWKDGRPWSRRARRKGKMSPNRTPRRTAPGKARFTQVSEREAMRRGIGPYAGKKGRARARSILRDWDREERGAVDRRWLKGRPRRGVRRSRSPYAMTRRGKRSARKGYRPNGSRPPYLHFQDVSGKGRRRTVSIRCLAEQKTIAQVCGIAKRHKGACKVDHRHGEPSALVRVTLAEDEVKAYDRALRGVKVGIGRWEPRAKIDRMARAGKVRVGWRGGAGAYVKRARQKARRGRR